MITFIINNLSTLIISAVLAVLMVLAVVYVIKQHKKGMCAGCGEKNCSSRCAGCQGGGSNPCSCGENQARFRHT